MIRRPKKRARVRYTGSFFLPSALKTSAVMETHYMKGRINMAKRVYLYAFNNVLRIVDTKFLEGDAISVRDMLRLANWMKDVNPGQVVVYAVDNRPGLYKEFMEAVKTKDFTKHVEFADLISREGILIG